MSNPPPIPVSIDVTVDLSTTPGTLIIDGNSLNDETTVYENTLAQAIEWNLVLANGQSGTFNALSTSGSSGFSWTSEPAPGTNIFWDYTETQERTQIGVKVWNTGPATEGTWTYKLRATVNDQPCESNPASIRGQTGDPKIHND